MTSNSKAFAVYMKIVTKFGQDAVSKFQYDPMLQSLHMGCDWSLSLYSFKIKATDDFKKGNFRDMHVMYKIQDGVCIFYQE